MIFQYNIYRSTLDGLVVTTVARVKNPNWKWYKPWVSRYTEAITESKVYSNVKWADAKTGKEADSYVRTD